MIRRIVAQIVANTLGLLAVSMLVAGVSVEGGIVTFVFGGAVLGVLNTFVKPLLKLFSLPFIFLSMGLFSVVINAGVLYLMEKLVAYLVAQPQLQEAMSGVSFAFASWSDYIIAAVVISLCNLVTYWFLKLDK